MSEQAPPYDLAAEEATIGALLIDPDAMPRVMETGLRPESFWIARLGIIFRAILALHERGEPADYILVVAELRESGQLDNAGGPAKLTELIGRCPTSVYATHYANLVLRCALQRRVILMAGRAAQMAYEGNRSMEELRKAVRDLADSVGTDQPNGLTIQGVLR